MQLSSRVSSPCVRGCTQGRPTEWVDWLYGTERSALGRKTEHGGACEGSRSGLCLSKEYSCFQAEHVRQPAPLLPESRQEHFVRAVVTQRGQMFSG